MRDRDDAGRPRNARPRDAYGRPLPRGAEGEPTIPEDIELTPAQTLGEAQRLLDADRPFHAHEVLEAAWKTGPPGERDLWQGLAQVAVGLTHVRRDNPQGAVALLQRAADRIEPYAAAGDGGPYGIDVRGLMTHVRGLASRIDRDGLDGIGDGELRPRLTEDGRTPG